MVSIDKQEAVIASEAIVAVLIVWGTSEVGQAGSHLSIVPSGHTHRPNGAV